MEEKEKRRGKVGEEVRERGEDEGKEGEGGGGGGGGGGDLHKANQQIFRTKAESQRIVAARPLCRLQYPVRAKSSAKDLPH